MKATALVLAILGVMSAQVFAATQDQTGSSSTGTNSEQQAPQASTDVPNTGTNPDEQVNPNNSGTSNTISGTTEAAPSTGKKSAY
jgi:uncharacterized protein with NAD-binding domain and iron-sulfur cluster